MQEVVRILSRCSPSLPWNQKASYVSALCAREVVTSGLAAYQSILDKEDRPLQRSDSHERDVIVSYEYNCYKKDFINFIWKGVIN